VSCTHPVKPADKAGSAKMLRGQAAVAG